MSNEGSQEKTIYIIDGFAQIFRAYYAIMSGITSPHTGEPTAVSFGMAGMFLKLFREFHPHYVVMASDSKGKTFRDELYPEYKANRDPAPEDLKAQIPRVFEISRRFGVPVVEYPGAEADDVIATMVRNILQDPEHKDIHIRIVSKDKDLEQLLGDRVEMFDIHKDEVIDVNTLKEKKGIKPDQVIDMLALMGDKSDNVPGVEGIGPKTAAKLINEFGTMENLLANTDKIKGKRRENIEKAIPHLSLSKTLVTLKDDLTLDFEFKDSKVGGLDAAALRELFQELGFRRHLIDLDALLESQGGLALGGTTSSTGKSVSSKASKSRQAAAPGQGSLFDMSMDDDSAQGGGSGDEDAGDARLTNANENDYQAITTSKQLDDLIKTLSKLKLFSIDTETVGLGMRAGLCGICLSWNVGHAVYVPVLSPTPELHLDLEEVRRKLGPILNDPSIGKIGHNIKYDIHVLVGAGMPVRGVVFDTMVAAHLTDQAVIGLDWLARNLLHHRMIPISDLIGPPPKGGRGKQKTMDQVPLELITPYGAEDADLTLRLYELLSKKMKLMGVESLAHDVEMPLVEVLAIMEQNGIRVDPDILTGQKVTLAKRIDELRDDIYEAAGGLPFNIDSPKQLAEVLFKQLKLPVGKRTKTGPSTDIEVLEKLADREDLDAEKTKVPRLIVEYRQLRKLVNTYLDALVEDIDPNTHRVHASFHQTGTATGRLSSSDPNLQNIPIRTDIGRQVRKAFVAETGHQLVSADYSQIELRILAHLSGDQALSDAFKKGMDIHTAVAVEVFEIKPDEVTVEQRTRAKTINFGIVYGVTPYGLARRIENLDVPGAKRLIADYHRRFPGISKFLDKCVGEADDKGYVTTMLGRRRSIPQIHSRQGNTRSLGERLAINSVVQGSAADLIKVAMVRLQRRIEAEKLPMKLLLQIHDELVVEAPTEHAQSQSDIVVEVMESAMTLDVPLKVDASMGGDWFEAK
jgi:DNA polymerase-1